MPSIVYPFHVSERIVFEEIYFPKRAAYYGAIFKALREGHNEEIVRDYLSEHAMALLEEIWVTSHFTMNLNVIKRVER